MRMAVIAVLAALLYRWRPWPLRHLSQLYRRLRSYLFCRPLAPHLVRPLGERWYTGFTMSYPPLSQQSVALVSFLTGDLRLAFAIVQTLAMINLTVGMVRFAHLWVSDEAAGWAGLWLVSTAAMAETIHVFGQLPTTFSLGMLLNSLPFAHRWIVADALPI